MVKDANRLLKKWKLIKGGLIDQSYSIRSQENKILYLFLSSCFIFNPNTLCYGCFRVQMRKREIEEVQFVSGNTHTHTGFKTSCWISLVFSSFLVIMKLEVVGLVPHQDIFEGIPVTRSLIFCLIFIMENFRHTQNWKNNVLNSKPFTQLLWL